MAAGKQGIMGSDNTYSLHKARQGGVYGSFFSFFWGVKGFILIHNTMYIS